VATETGVGRALASNVSMVSGAALAPHDPGVANKASALSTVAAVKANDFMLNTKE
jgi:hypothetical protein